MKETELELWRNQPITRRVLADIKQEIKDAEGNLFNVQQDQNMTSDLLGLMYTRKIHYLQGLHFILKTIEGDYDI